MDVIHTKMQLRQDNKHRVITNILHLAELIKIAENKYKHPNQLIKWYREQITNNDNNSEAELRLENDDNLIKIVTIHGSKGLEYPVVFVPFATKINSKKFTAKDFNKYYDKESAQTVYKLGKDQETTELVNNETLEESKRLLYVAITRASQRCYVGVAGFKQSEKSPLAQFVGYIKDDDWQQKLLAITNNPENHSKLVDVSNSTQHSVIPDTDPESTYTNTNLQANTINLPNDNWQMLSFSKITKGNHQSIGLEKEDDEATDEEMQSHSKAKLDFRFTAKKGADIGNLLHNVLENTDFSTGGIDDDILQQQFNRYRVVEKEDYDSLKDWLVECLNAPINRISHSHAGGNLNSMDGYSKDTRLHGYDDYAESDSNSVISDSDPESRFCLKDIANNKTLKEPEFYFPIKNNNLNKSKLMQILSKYRGEEIAEPRYEKIFGMLHGFIDLLFEHNGKFFVADYKSNYLGDSLEDYNQQAMSEKIELVSMICSI